MHSIIWNIHWIWKSRYPSGKKKGGVESWCYFTPWELKLQIKWIAQENAKYTYISYQVIEYSNQAELYYSGYILRYLITLSRYQAFINAFSSGKPPIIIDQFYKDQYIYFSIPVKPHKFLISYFLYKVCTLIPILAGLFKLTTLSFDNTV